MIAAGKLLYLTGRVRELERVLEAARAVSGRDAELLARNEETFRFNQPKRAALVDALASLGGPRVAAESDRTP